jgi:hypothetical protein
MIEELLERMERVMSGEKEGVMYLTDHAAPQAGPSRLSKAVSFGSGRYMLMAGPPGTGKTAWVDSNMVIKPLLASIYGAGTPVNYIYRTMERGRVDKLAKWVSAIIMMDTKQLIPPSVLLGQGNAPRPLTKEDIAMVREYSDLFKVIEQRVDLIQGAATPADVLKYAVTSAKRRGILFETKQDKLICNDELVGEFTHDVEVGGVRKRYAETQYGNIFEGEMRFLPHDQKIYVHIVDHVGKIVGDEEKKKIDTHSNNMANTLRDVFGYAVIDIFQLNRDLHDTYRQKQQRLTIKQSDIKGSNVPVENADIILGILDPHAFDVKDYDGFDVIRFVDPRTNFSRLRMLVGVKNSYGGTTFSLPLVFYGENGLTYEAPNPMTINEFDFERILKGMYSSFG